MTLRSALIGVVTLVRLLSSARVREEFRRARLVSAASTNEVNARLARLRRERYSGGVSLHVVAGCKDIRESDVLPRSHESGSLDS
jgi:hypothetical protein